MTSSTIRLNEYEAGVLWDALQGKEPTAEQREKAAPLFDKIRNVLRQARVRAGIAMPVQRSIPRRRALRINDGAESLAPRGGAPVFRQPK